jgi:tol-pal system protein YbgF
MNTMVRLALIGVVLAGPCAHAGPAEDALVRVGELQKTQQAQQEQLARLDAQMNNQGMISLLNQVEALKAEIARLRGFQEEQAYQMDVAEKRVKDLFLDLDTRLNEVKELVSRPLPPQSDSVRLQSAHTLTNAPAAAPSLDPDAEARAYGGAHALVKAGKYRDAVRAMQSFLEQYPGGSLAPNAVYWMGFSQVNLGDFSAAATAYQKLIDEYPTSSKAPDAMLSLARARIQTNEMPQARTTLEQLIDKYPVSKAASAGKKLLATLN